jgi:anti-sigma-K factor RskA
VTGNLVVSADGMDAVLFLRGLAPLDEDHAYQVWLIPASGAPQSAGVFPLEEAEPVVSFLVSSPAPIQDFAALGVTVEPRAGSLAPTTEPIVVREI